MSCDYIMVSIVLNRYSDDENIPWNIYISPHNLLSIRLILFWMTLKYVVEAQSKGIKGIIGSQIEGVK